MRSFILGLAMLSAALGTAVPTALAATNEQAAQQIAKNLKDSGKLKGYRVGVKYEDGVAWLMGTVTSEKQLQIAEQIASTTPGVDHVICKLEIAAPEGENFEPATFEEQPQTVSKPAAQQPRPAAANRRSNMPVPYAYMGQGHPRSMPPQGMPPQGMPPQGNVQAAAYSQQAQYCPEGGYGAPAGMSHTPAASGAGVAYDNPQVPGYAWPSYAASPNYAALTYPQQYSASAWPYIGPFYPYPQVPLGWRKVTLEWDDGWWFLDFKDSKHCK
jgi:hypothetical protein